MDTIKASAPAKIILFGDVPSHHGANHQSRRTNSHTSSGSAKTGRLRQVGELMNINHALLYTIGVSRELLERLVNAARKAGALGAKLTGAGGGGCMVALAETRKLTSIAKAIAKVGGNSFIAKKSNEGVRIEG